MSRVLQIVLIVAILVFFVLVGRFIGLQFGSGGEHYPSDRLSGSEHTIHEVYNIINARYVDEVDDDVLTASAIEGMTQALDPHTTYLKADQVRFSNAEFEGNFEGIGIEFDIVHDTLLVVTPLAGGPSEAAGLKAGDRIIAIDGKPALALTPMEVISRLRGPKGSEVSLTIFRPYSSRKFGLDIVRDKIPTFSIDAVFMLDAETGYIRMSRFVATTAQEFREAMGTLLDLGMQNVVIDVRGNPGGYLDQAVEIADEFLSEGKLIVYTKSRNGGPDEMRYTATSGGLFEKRDVMVLVDRGSASAAEILAGALQDNKRAGIAGELTFGKGLVQRQFDLADSSAIRLTIARYFTPSGRRIQRDYSPGSEGRELYYQEVHNNLDGKTLENESREIECGIDGIEIYKPSTEQFESTGGIVPDFWVVESAVNGFYGKLLENGVFDETALKIIDDPSSRVRQYSGDVDGFIEDYSEEKKMEQYLRDICRDKNLQFDESQFVKEKKEIMSAVKSRVARQQFGIEAQIKVLAKESDKLLWFARDYLRGKAA